MTWIAWLFSSDWLRQTASATRLKRSSRSFSGCCQDAIFTLQVSQRIHTNPIQSQILVSHALSLQYSATTCFHFPLLHRFCFPSVSPRHFICMHLSFSFLPALPLPLLWWRGWCRRLRPPQWFGRLTNTSTRSDTRNGSSPQQSN